MQRASALVLPILLAAAGCAQVPREAIDLSVVVGRDLGELHRSHRELVRIVHDRQRERIREFVDEVYLPFQIQKLLAVFGPELKKAIDRAADPDSSEDERKAALAMMGVFFEDVTREVQDYRDLKLAVIDEKETELLTAIDGAYGQVVHANSVVTGHLASIRRVQETRAELLAQAGLGDLEQRIATRVAGTSDSIARLTRKVRKGDETLEGAVKQLDGLLSGEASGAGESGPDGGD
ncbi:MAG TPA: hypothetical protein VMS76_19135 [Planctomycetota bacterium]|nr:hypothetical protein [Planctomycetota bacterium]